MLSISVSIKFNPVGKPLNLDQWEDATQNNFFWRFNRNWKRAWLTLQQFANHTCRKGFPFAPFEFRDGRRAVDTPIGKADLLILEYDHIGDEEQLAAFLAYPFIQNNVCLVGHSSSSQPGAYRAKALVHLSEGVTPEEYRLLARHIGEQLAPPGVDPSSYQPSRPQFGDRQRRKPLLFKPDNVLDISDLLGSIREKISEEERQRREKSERAKENSLAATDKAALRYVEAAILGEIDKCNRAAKGDGNNVLYRSAIALGGLAKGGYLSESQIEPILLNTDAAKRRKEHEAKQTIQSGISIAEARYIPASQIPVAQWVTDLAAAPQSAEENDSFPDPLPLSLPSPDDLIRKISERTALRNAARHPNDLGLYAVATIGAVITEIDPEGWELPEQVLTIHNETPEAKIIRYPDRKSSTIVQGFWLALIVAIQTAFIHKEQHQWWHNMVSFFRLVDVLLRHGYKPGDRITVGEIVDLVEDRYDYRRRKLYNVLQRDFDLCHLRNVISIGFKQESLCKDDTGEKDGKFLPETAFIIPDPAAYAEQLGVHLGNCELMPLEALPDNDCYKAYLVRPIMHAQLFDQHKVTPEQVTTEETSRPLNMASFAVRLAGERSRLKQVVNLSGVTPRMIREWIKSFAQFFTDEATRRQRVLTLEDVRVLATISNFTQQGITHEDIQRRLTEGERIEQLPENALTEYLENVPAIATSTISRSCGLLKIAGMLGSKPSEKEDDLTLEEALDHSAIAAMKKAAEGGGYTCCLRAYTFNERGERVPILTSGNKWIYNADADKWLIQRDENHQPIKTEQKPNFPMEYSVIMRLMEKHSPKRDPRQTYSEVKANIVFAMVRKTANSYWFPDLASDSYDPALIPVRPLSWQMASD